MAKGPIEISEIIDTSKDLVDVSVVMYVDRHVENVTEIYAYVANILSQEKKTFEFIFVDDGNGPSVFSALQTLHGFVKNAKVIRLPRFYGISTAMMVGFRHARGTTILTLGSFLQVQPSEIRRMFRRLDEGFDFVNGWRVRRTDSPLNRWQTRFYNWLIRRFLEVDLHDTNCTLKLFKRRVVGEVPIYGDTYRFMPVLAARMGFRVTEIPVEQRTEINRYGVYGVGVYLRRILDLLAIMFMGRFTRKPLRFFGSVGSILFLAGLAINLYLVYLKYVWMESLAGRPLLILGTLLMVLGVQTGSIGLIGELILFTHADDMKDYQIQEILE